MAKHRAIALLSPSLRKVFDNTPPSATQWGFIGKFLKNNRVTARDDLKVEFPASKGKWKSQHQQLEAYDKVAEEIAKR